MASALGQAGYFQRADILVSPFEAKTHSKEAGQGPSLQAVGVTFTFLSLGQRDTRASWIEVKPWLRNLTSQLNPRWGVGIVGGVGLRYFYLGQEGATVQPGAEQLSVCLMK